MKFKKATVITVLASVLLVAGTATAFATSAQKRSKTNNTNSDTSSTSSADTTKSDIPTESDNFTGSEPAASKPTPSKPQPIDLGNGFTAAEPLLDKSQYVELPIVLNPEEYLWREEDEKFLDSLGVPEIKSLYMRAQTLCTYLSTSDLPDTEIVWGNGERRWYDILRKDGKFYGETGFTYDSVYNAYLSAFTEETTKEIFKNHDFLNFNDGFFCQMGAKGGNLFLVRNEFELISKTDTVIEYRRTTFNLSNDMERVFPPKYDPALRDQYDKEYIDFKFVKTENGWRAEKFLDAETKHWAMN